MQNEANKSSASNADRRSGAELVRLRGALLSVLLSGNSGGSAQTGAEYELRKAALNAEEKDRAALLARAASLRQKELRMKERQKNEPDALSPPTPRMYIPETLPNDKWETKWGPHFAAMLPKPQESPAEGDLAPTQKRSPEYYSGVTPAHHPGGKPRDRNPEN